MRGARYQPGPAWLLAMAIAGSVGFAAGVGAEPALAPPGACAQQDAELARQARLTPPPFDVGGAPIRHFSPTQVAANAPAGLPLPEDLDIADRGGCDSPDAGCAGAIEQSIRPIRALVEAPAVPSLPPGSGQGDGQ